MKDSAPSNNFTPPASIKGDVKSVASRRAKPKPEPTPLAAYSSVSFVCGYNRGERLNGDRRLEVDLCARLSDGLNIPSHFFSTDDDYEKDDDGKTLYIAVHCRLPERLKPVSICINNDRNNFRNYGDFYFEPFFKPFIGEFPENAHVYPINILPSRATQKNIASELIKEPFSSDGKPVIALMLRGPRLYDLVKIKQIAESLQQKHQARFLISTGPRSYSGPEEIIQTLFKDLDHVQMFLWDMSCGAQNPYLWMLGAATHLVTSGTISTTSDLLATGKPVYYTDIPPLCSYDGKLKDELLAKNAVGHFDDQMLDRAPPPDKIRRKFQKSWIELSRRFCKDLNALLQRRNNQFQPDSRITTQVTNG